MILLCLIDDTFAFEVASRLSCMIEKIQVANLVGSNRVPPLDIAIESITKTEQIILPPSFCQSDRATFIATETRSSRINSN